MFACCQTRAISPNKHEKLDHFDADKKQTDLGIMLLIRMGDFWLPNSPFSWKWLWLVLNYLWRVPCIMIRNGCHNSCRPCVAPLRIAGRFSMRLFIERRGILGSTDNILIGYIIKGYFSFIVLYWHEKAQKKRAVPLLTKEELFVLYYQAHLVFFSIYRDGITLFPTAKPTLQRSLFNQLLNRNVTSQIEAGTTFLPTA